MSFSTIDRQQLTYKQTLSQCSNKELKIKDFYKIGAVVIFFPNRNIHWRREVKEKEEEAADKLCACEDKTEAIEN